MAAYEIRRLGYALGAEVIGLDFDAPLAGETIAELRRAWLEHHVLCFRDVAISKERFVEFGARFGEVDNNPISKTRDPDNTHLILITNQPIAGRPWDGYKEGQIWHSDRSFAVRPTTGSFLLAQHIPEVGGDTLFANQYMAYDALSAGMRGIVDDLHAVFDITKRYGEANYQQQSAEVLARSRKNNPPVAHRAARVHPETQRKALYLGERVDRFVGMTWEESRPLLEMLNAHSVRYEFTYRHRWRPHDLVLWDNRCLLHRALTDFDIGHEARHMWRCSLRGPETGVLLTESGELPESLSAAEPAAVAR